MTANIRKEMVMTTPAINNSCATLPKPLHWKMYHNFILQQYIDATNLVTYFY